MDHLASRGRMQRAAELTLRKQRVPRIKLLLKACSGCSQAENDAGGVDDEGELWRERCSDQPLRTM